MIAPLTPLLAGEMFDAADLFFQSVGLLYKHKQFLNDE